MAKKDTQGQTEGQASAPAKKQRNKSAAGPMQIWQATDSVNVSDPYNLGSFVAEVKDVGAARKYIRDNKLSGKFVVIAVKATLNAQVVNVERVTFA